MKQFRCACLSKVVFWKVPGLYGLCPFRIKAVHTLTLACFMIRQFFATFCFSHQQETYVGGQKAEPITGEVRGYAERTYT